MRRRLIRIALILLLFPPLLAAVAGWLFGPAFLHPIRRQLSPDLIREADASFAVTGASREDFDVRAPDGAPLRGWKVRPKNPNGNWVLLFHGVADNRIGVVGQLEFLLRDGYSVVMMDARAHGVSGGPIATYGWLERNDTRAIIDELVRSEVGRYADEQLRSGKWKLEPVEDSDLQEPIHPPVPLPGAPLHLFALGESMGAGIALQSAAADPRIEAVVAEASFADLREGAYDYAGLRKFPWLGKTLFAPGAWALLYRAEKLAGLPAAEVSPVKAVASRAFPVLLICDEMDVALPCRHSEKIYAAARGPKQLWVVPRAFHTAAYGFEPEEFRRRVLSFFAAHSSAADSAPSQNLLPSPLQHFFPARPSFPQTKKAASAALANALAMRSRIAHFSPSLLSFLFLASLFFFSFCFLLFSSLPSASSVYSAPSALNSLFSQLFNSKHPASIPFSVFQFPFSTPRSVHGMLPRFPFLAQPAHGLPQAHRQRGNRFEPLFSAVREFAVIFPVNLRQQEFRVSQNPRQRIVQLVAEHLSKIFLRFLERIASAVRHPLRLPQAAPDQAQRQRQASSIAHHIIGGARIDQRREFYAPLRRPNHDHRRIDRQRGHHRVEPWHDSSRSIAFGRDRRLFE